MAKMDWGKMMGAMNSVENGTGGASRIPLGLGDDLNQVSEADMRPPTVADMEINNKRQAAKQGDALDADFAKYHEPEQPRAVAPQQRQKNHKGSYECANMYAQMLESTERVKAVEEGYVPPAPVHQRPAPQSQTTTSSYGGSYVDQVRALNENKKNDGTPSLLGGSQSAYEDFIKEDYNRKRGAIHAIREKLNTIDINTCEPDGIISGMVKVIKKLNGE
jgi:hypothetical protein